ncbi:hypothetical protein D3C86_2063070 [compost metagenome]
MDVSPSPSSRIKTGRIASAAVLRSSSRGTFSRSAACFHQPIASPSGMLMMTASRKPPRERDKLASV